MILEQLIYGRKYAAVEHAEVSRFHYLQLAKQQREFVIAEKEHHSNFDSILETLKGQKHLFVIFNDEQILSKKIETASTETKVILRTAFPNIALSDFYYEILRVGSYSYVNIARKKYIDSWLYKYTGAKISVIDFSLGNLTIKNLKDFIKEKTLFTTNAEITFGLDTIDNIKKETVKEDQYSINDLVVSNTELLPLGGILSYYSKNSASLKHKELEEKYRHKRFFDIGFKFALGFLFTLLLGNTFLFSHYQNKVATIKDELQLSNTYKTQLSFLQYKVDQKNRLLQSVESASNLKLSKYMDEIGLSIPHTILLSEILYQPIKGSKRADKPIVFDIKKINIKGTSKDDEAFAAWISLLEQKNWISNIETKAYGKGRKRKPASSFEFSITIYE